MKKLFYLILISILTLSCSNELSRGDAEDKIEEFFEYPNVELTNFPGVTSSQKLNNEYQSLRGQKFISEQRKGRYGNEFWVVMTEKGNGFVHSGEASYNGYKVASSILELNEVTGIRLEDGKNTAVVDFTLKRTNVSPFGNAKEFYDGDIIKKQTVFQLYDDGWRITGKKPKTIIKKNDIAGLDENFIKNIEEEMRIGEVRAKEWALKNEYRNNQANENESELFEYKGKIKSYPITMKIKFYGEYNCNDDGSLIEGYYYYNKSGESNKLILKGHSCGTNITIEEKDSNNKTTGIFNGIKNSDKIEGVWRNPKTNKKLNFTIRKE